MPNLLLYHKFQKISNFGRNPQLVQTQLVPALTAAAHIKTCSWRSLQLSQNLTSSKLDGAGRILHMKNRPPKFDSRHSVMLSCYVNQAAKPTASRVSQDFKFVKYFFIKFKIAETLEAVRLKRLSTIYPQKREVIHILSTGFGINPQTLQPCDFQRFFPNACSPPEVGAP